MARIYCPYPFSLFFLVALRLFLPLNNGTPCPDYPAIGTPPGRSRQPPSEVSDAGPRLPHLTRAVVAGLRCREGRFRLGYPTPILTSRNFSPTCSATPCIIIEVQHIIGKDYLKHVILKPFYAVHNGIPQSFHQDLTDSRVEKYVGLPHSRPICRRKFSTHCVGDTSKLDTT